MHVDRCDQLSEHRLDGGGLTMRQGGVELSPQGGDLLPVRTVGLVLLDVGDLVAPGL
ncbi:MAG: hypothetical protein ACYCVN_02285 [Acidimicrobiales bacterium]